VSSVYFWAYLWKILTIRLCNRRFVMVGSMIRRVSTLLVCSPIALAQQTDDPLGFGCTGGVYGAAWQSAKTKIRTIFKSDSAGLVHAEKKVLAEVFATVNKDLADSGALSEKASGECGMGRLALQLLSITPLEPEVQLELFSSSEKMASPVLTSLIDVPWLAVAQSGWPIYGLLAEINLQKRAAGVVNKEAVDGLDQPIGQAFYNELSQALIKGDGAAIGEVTKLYIAMDNEKNLYAYLSALAAGAAGSNPQQRMQLMDTVQTVLKQYITTGVALDITLGTRWPFWGVAHAASDVFAVV